MPEISDLFLDPEKGERGAIVPVVLGEENGLTVGSVQRLTVTPPRRGGKVPVPAQQEAFPSSRYVSCAAGSRAHPMNPAGPPLHGIRVIDFRWAGRGRYAPEHWLILALTCSRSRPFNIPIGGAVLTGVLLTSMADVRKDDTILRYEPQQTRYHAGLDAAVRRSARQTACGGSGRRRQ